MSKEKHRKDSGGCPVESFFKSMEAIFNSGSDIGGHLQRSQLELLKAIRAWADGRIAHIEQQHSSERRKKVTKIKVE
jgi:hypothetical protein